jgi:hypothetical protein
VQEYVPVVCGEWCIFNSLAVGMDTKGGQSSLNGIDFSDSKTVSEEEKGDHLHSHRQGTAGRLGKGQRLLLLDL